MAVFDPRQGQVLVSPVTNFYQGKAIRQQQKDAEQMGRMRELQIEEAEYQASPERRAKAEEILDLKLQQARSAVDQAEVSLGADTLKFMANTLAPITSGATSMAMSGDLEGATEYYNREIKRLLPTLPGPIAEAVQKGAGPDKVYSPEEIANTKLMLSQWGAKNDVNRKPVKFMMNGQPIQGTVDPYGNYYDGTGNLATGNITPYDSPLVSISNDTETEAAKVYGKKVGERAAQRDDAAQSSIQDDVQLDRIQLAMARGARTGFGEDVILNIRGALETLGVADLPQGAQESEVVRSVGNILALRMRNPESGLGLPGNTSNKDLQFLKDATAGINRSEGANLLLIKQAKKLNQFKRDIVAEQARIITENNGIPNDLDAQLMKYANNYKLLSDEERKEIEKYVQRSEDDIETNAVPIESWSDDAILNKLNLPPRD